MSSSMAKPTGPLRATPITNSTNLPEQTGKKVYFNKINLVTTPDHFWPLECLRKRLHKINCTVAMSNYYSVYYIICYTVRGIILYYVLKTLSQSVATVPDYRKMWLATHVHVCC